MIDGIGQGADWVPADRLLLATDERRLVTVTVVRGTPRAGSALQLAEAVARAVLASR
jgi:hypothetical protein